MSPISGYIMTLSTVFLPPLTHIPMTTTDLGKKNHIEEKKKLYRGIQNEGGEGERPEPPTAHDVRLTEREDECCNKGRRD